MRQLTRWSKNLLSPLIEDREARVFCVSMQRTGTTSVGKFFRDTGFRWAGWPADEKNKWSSSWYDGDYESIFSSSDFQAANAFEDSPWWLPGFYKVLFHRFPNSRFVLFTRDPDDWFHSMLSHSGGNVTGNIRNHCKVYRREREYDDFVKRNPVDDVSDIQRLTGKTLSMVGYEEHYKSLYHLHNSEVQEFFQRHRADALHVGRLEDPDKWMKLGEFLGVDVPGDYESRENVSGGASS